MKKQAVLRVVLALALAALPATAQATPEVWSRSYALEAQGNARGALEALDTLAASERAGYLFHLRRAWLLYSVGRYEESITTYRAAETDSPAALEPRLGELLPLLALRRWTEAETRARDVLSRDADNYLANRRLALALYNLGRFEQAEQVYRQVLAGYPSDLEMLSGVGWCAVRRGRREEAAAAFRQVLSVSPEDATARAGLTAAGGQ